jgi:hypothetical protein
MTTERHMLDLLARRYDEHAGNGQRWVIADQVRNGTGFYGWSEERQRCAGTVRTADFVAIDGWESKRHAIHGHEVKVSRSDWLTELRDPEKSVQWRGWCNYWWLVVADATIVHPGELPAGWGLLVATGTRLVARHKAPWQVAAPMPLPVQIGLMRSVAKTAARHAMLGRQELEPIPDRPAPAEHVELPLFEVSA